MNERVVKKVHPFKDDDDDDDDDDDVDDQQVL